MNARAFELTPLGDDLNPGVRINGLTREAIDDPAVAEALRAIWIDRA
jgi:hypothetical protein